MRYRTIYFLSILIISMFLIFFSQKRNNKIEKLKVNIDFVDKNANFFDSIMVNKLLIQSKDTKFYLNKDMVDLKVVEDLLKSNPMIASADIYKTPQGVLNIKLEERKPIIRIINSDEEYYLDNFGFRVPLSENYSPRVPIFYGRLDSDLMDLVNFTKVIKSDSFAGAEIIDLKNSNNNYILGIRSYPFKIIWGNNSKNKNKIKKLKYLFSYLDERDYLKIKKVNLSFDKQIVLEYGENGE